MRIEVIRVFMKGKVVDTSQWRSSFQRLVMEERTAPITGPVTVSVSLFMRRPRGHFAGDKVKPEYQTLTAHEERAVWRVARVVERALEGVAYESGRQIIHMNVGKGFAAGEIPEGVSVTVAQYVNYADAMSDGRAFSP